MIDFAAQRTKMVESQVRTEGVTDYRILDAMGAVRRERFVPEGVRHFAYLDEDLRVTGPGEPARYLMRPAAFARLVQLAEVGENDKVLVVGAGTGYSAAVLARLAKAVIALEAEPRLLTFARSALGEEGVANATVVSGPLNEGWAPEGPYALIVLEGAVEMIPDGLGAQLAEGARLVAVLGAGGAASAVRYTKVGRELAGQPDFSLSVRSLPGFESPKAFVF